MAFQPERTTILTDVAVIGVAKVNFDRSPFATEGGLVCTGNGFKMPTVYLTELPLKYSTLISAGRGEGKKKCELKRNEGDEEGRERQTVRARAQID